MSIQLNYQRDFTLNCPIETCRTAIRLDIFYPGTIKNEVNQNCFEFKNLCVDNGIFYKKLGQYTVVLLEQKSETDTVIHIQTSPFEQVDGNEELWKTQMEQLVNFLWTDICKVVENRKNPPSVFPSSTSPSPNLSAQTSSTIAQPRQDSFYLRHKRAIWGIAIGLCIVVLLALILPTLMGESTQKYVGTNSNWDVVVELKADNTFVIEETNLSTGVVTRLTGSYEYLGTNNSILQFSPNGGSGFRCEIMVNIHGTPFILFPISNYPACYKQ